MPKILTPAEQLMQNQSPINWGRAMLSGVIGVSLMMAFVDVFAMMGFTNFTYETYLGTLLRSVPYGAHNWTVGVLVNWVTGGIFGVIYGYFFEFEFKKANPKTGLKLGLYHLVFAGIAFFPFFNSIHEQLGRPFWNGFGFLGSGFGLGTTALIIVSHLIFGATVGLLYGPVRLGRVRARQFEIGELGQIGEPGVVTAEEDPDDRVAA